MFLGSLTGYFPSIFATRPVPVGQQKDLTILAAQQAIKTAIPSPTEIRTPSSTGSSPTDSQRSSRSNSSDSSPKNLSPESPTVSLSFSTDKATTAKEIKEPDSIEKIEAMRIRRNRLQVLLMALIIVAGACMMIHGGLIPAAAITGFLILLFVISMIRESGQKAALKKEIDETHQQIIKLDPRIGTLEKEIKKLEEEEIIYRLRGYPRGYNPIVKLEAARLELSDRLGSSFVRELAHRKYLAESRLHVLIEDAGK